MAFKALNFVKHLGKYIINFPIAEKWQFFFLLLYVSFSIVHRHISSLCFRLEFIPFSLKTTFSFQTISSETRWRGKGKKCDRLPSAWAPHMLSVCSHFLVTISPHRMLEITHERRFTVEFDRQRRRKWALRQKVLGTIINCDSVIRRLTRYYSISSTVILYYIIYVLPPPPPLHSFRFLFYIFFLGCFGLAAMCARCVCGCSVESICLIHSSAAVPSLCLYSYKLISCFIYEALSSSLCCMCLLFYFIFFVLLLVFSFASGVDIDIQKNTNTIPHRESVFQRQDEMCRCLYRGIVTTHTMSPNVVQTNWRRWRWRWQRRRHGRQWMTVPNGKWENRKHSDGNMFHFVPSSPWFCVERSICAQIELNQIICISETRWRIKCHEQFWCRCRFISFIQTNAYWSRPFFLISDDHFIVHWAANEMTKKENTENGREMDERSIRMAEKHNFEYINQLMNECITDNDDDGNKIGTTYELRVFIIIY